MKQEIVMIMCKNTVTRIFYFFALLSLNYLYAIENLKVEPVSNVVANTSIYRFELKPATVLAADAEFEITFSKDFNLSQIVAAGSKNIPGGFKVRHSDNKVFITRTGLGKAIPAGETVEILLANVINPSSPGQNFILNFVIKNSAGEASETASARVVVQDQTTE